MNSPFNRRLVAIVEAGRDTNTLALAKAGPAQCGGSDAPPSTRNFRKFTAIGHDGHGAQPGPSGGTSGGMRRALVACSNE